MLIQMKSMVLGVITPCSLETAQHFRETYHFQILVQRVRQAKSLTPASTGFLLGLQFSPEDGGDVFL
jgi:hypothetical protein